VEVVLFFLLADVVIPLAIGIAIRKRLALVVVFVLWLALVAYFPVTYDWRYLDADDVSAASLFVLAVVLVLAPAEAVTAAGVALGRRLFPRGDRSEHVAARPPVENGA